MIFWIDAQLPPALVPWIYQLFAVEAVAVRDIGLRGAGDETIFLQAREAGAVVVTKDADFLLLSRRLGAPPQVLWLTCGNTSNERLRTILSSALPHAIELLGQGEPIVQITGDN